MIRATATSICPFVYLLFSLPIIAAPDFAKDIQPIFARHCYECHGSEEQKGKLRLDDRNFVLKEGKRVIVPSNAEDSELVRRISLPNGHDDIMPSRGEPLSQKQIAAIREWINQGAIWPEDAVAAKHWAYVAPARPALPKIKNQSWPKNEIDHFVLAKLEEQNLRPSPEAGRERLLRRVYLDLIGLPPSPSEIDHFLADKSPDAYERVVERLLASPHYGERWARPWLDLARYADSHGFQRDNLWSIWPYRDWVIRAFNADMPFDQFTIEQIAGDLLPNPTLDQKIATGFNRTSATNIEAGSDQEETRVNQVFDRVNTVGTVWLGSTLECAQCHNHKYDPFSQKEYYQLFAFFNNTPKETDKLRPNATAALKFTGPFLDVPDEKIEKQRAVVRKKISALDDQIKTATNKLLAAQSAWEEKISADLANAAQTHVFEIADFSSESDSLAEMLDDKSLLLRANANAATPVTDTYTITIHTKLAGITGFKLETLTHPSLPGNGPGRGDEKRPNFVLNDFSVIATENGDDREIKLRNARASFEQKGFPVAHAIDGKAKTGWAINPEFFKDHWATFETAEPVGSASGTTFIFKLEQNNGASRIIGRLRLSALTGGGNAETVPADIAEILSAPSAERSEAQQKRLTEFYLGRAPELVDLKAKRAQADKELNDLQLPQTLVMQELDQPRTTSVFVRGNFLEPGEPVQPDVPAVLHSLPEGPRNRLTLARWLASANNPLAARVAVNRWWMEIFGHGLVTTPEDFGIKGDLPTHPELLDWLAVEFMDPSSTRGNEALIKSARNPGITADTRSLSSATGKPWSTKHIHRLIVTSATYRQSAAATPQLLTSDDQNKLYARGPRFRMDAEMLRDNALAAAGLLSFKLGGQPVRPYQPPGIWESKVGGDRVTYDVSDGEDRYRRGIYTVWKRTSPYPSFITFDAPNRNTCIVKRPRSNTPLQALTLLNDPVYVEAAKALAKRVLTERASADIREKLRYAFQLCTARHPTTPEMETLLHLYNDQLQASQSASAEKLFGDFPKPDGVTPAEFAAWYSVATALLNLDETITKG